MQAESAGGVAFPWPNSTPLAHPVNHFPAVNKTASRISPGKTRVEKVFREKPAELWPIGLSGDDTLVTLRADENETTFNRKRMMTAENTNLLTMFGATQDQLDEIQAEASEKNTAKQSRCDASLFQCSIPDWTGQGGVCHFWLNGDGTYESMDSRIGDAEIREGLMRAARN